MGNILTHIRDFSASAHPATNTSKKFWEDHAVESMNSDFEDQFLELEVEAVGAVTLSISKLEKNSLDAPILAELGEKAVTSVLHFAELLNYHRGSSETFSVYLRGLDGELWAVRALLFTDRNGWSVGARPVRNSLGWRVGPQLVSRLPAGKAGK